MSSHDLIWHMHEHIVPAAFSLLPAKMTSQEAEAMLLAIGLHETKFESRTQIPNGQAHGFLQFERGGACTELIRNPVSASYLKPIMEQLCYEPTPLALYGAIVHNDVLMMVAARLLLWLHPRRMPGPGNSEALNAYSIYILQWKPGRERSDEWYGNYGWAWEIVQEG